MLQGHFALRECSLMDIGDNFSNSFDYAKKLFSDGGRLIILIILDIIPIVDWIVVGYASRVLKEAPGGENPPKLENYGDLFINGAKVFFVSLIYMIIPLALIGAGIGSFLSALFMGGGLMAGTPQPMEAAGTMFLGGTGLVLLLVGAILAFLALIVLGAATAHMIKEGKFGKAFAFGEILDVIRRIGWGKYLTWVVLVAIIAIVVGAITGVIPFVGWLIEVVIAPAASVFFFRSLGLLYSDKNK
jgi:hypothetical protein